MVVICHFVVVDYDFAVVDYRFAMVDYDFVVLHCHFVDLHYGFVEVHNRFVGLHYDFVGMQNHLPVFTFVPPAFRPNYAKWLTVKNLLGRNLAAEENADHPGGRHNA